jgi:tryptophan-rich sensory protein
MRNTLKLVTSVLICLVAGGLGTIFTISAIPTWYAHLNKPPFSPPNWIFAPVWTTLYILMGIAIYLIWKKGFKTKKVRDAVCLFGVQLVLNAIWSPIFFGMHNLLLALVVIVVMWIYIVKTIRAFAKVDKTASLLLYPYILWVSFATILNASVWLLNK